MSLALDNGLRRLPVMGYNTWYDTMGAIDENNCKKFPSMPSWTRNFPNSGTITGENPE